MFPSWHEICRTFEMGTSHVYFITLASVPSLRVKSFYPVTFRIVPPGGWALVEQTASCPWLRIGQGPERQVKKSIVLKRSDISALRLRYPFNPTYTARTHSLPQDESNIDNRRRTAFEQFFSRIGRTVRVTQLM